MRDALARQEAGMARVIPIILRPVDLEGAPFAHLQYLPHHGKPVTKWSNRDEAFLDIARGIRRAIKDLQGASGSSYQSSVFPPIINSTPRKSRSWLFMAADLPQDFVARPQEFEALKQSILYGQRDRPTAITAALRGAGGYGKTTLAQALCHDPDIRNAFPNGVLWVTLGEKSINLVAKIEDIIFLLDHQRPGFTSLEAVMTEWRETLADRTCLLVIDDVWRSSDLIPFLQGGEQCARLITTRNDQVLPPQALCIQVDAMRQSEAVLLLQAGLISEPSAGELEQAFGQLARRLGEWPLLMTLANGVLRQRVRLGESLKSALTYLQHLLDKRGVLAFDAQNAEARSEAVSKTLEVSFAQLAPYEVARYEELAIFPEDAVLPFETVQRLWQVTGALDILETEELCRRLFSLSLLLSCDFATRLIQLHDVIHSYLRERVGARLTGLHEQFLDSYSLKRWAELPLDEPYLWAQLIEHLQAARRSDELVATVKDIRYLAAKALLQGTVALEQDLALALQEVPDDAILVSLVRQIAQIAHILQRSRTLDEMQGMLLTRIHLAKHLESLYVTVEQDISRFRFIAWHSLPDQGIPALRRTLTDHTGGVRDCAISPDGAWILSASNDKTLKVWDAYTGTERFTLSGHTQAVTGCAISPDGLWIISVSSDATLIVWDAHSGKRLTTFYTDRELFDCAFHPDGAHLIAVGERGVYFLRLIA